MRGHDPVVWAVRVIVARAAGPYGRPVLIMTSPPSDRRLVAAAIRHKSRSGLWAFPLLGLPVVVVSRDLHHQ
jgi:hypothetical protein